MVRAPFYDKNGMKKGAWSEEEDHKLRSYVEKFGHWNWREIPRFAGLKRCGKSCRLRWMNYLRPELKHGNFTEEEDALIMTLHEKFGNRWSMIAANLHGRTDNEIKNHWHTHLKKLSKQNLTKSDQGKDNSIVTSQSDSTHSSEGEAESICIDSPPILESSLLSTSPSSDSGPVSSISVDDLCLPSSFTPDSGSISDFNNNIGLIDEFCLPSSFRPDSGSISISISDFDIGFLDDVVLPTSFTTDNGSMSGSNNIGFMDDVCIPSCFIPVSGISVSDFSIGDMDNVCDLPLSQTLHEINQSSGDFWGEPFVAEHF